MAIDDAEKRKSISGIWIPLIPGVTPDSSKSAEWRAEAGWNYSGISFVAALEPSRLPRSHDDMTLLYQQWKFIHEYEPRIRIL